MSIAYSYITAVDMGKKEITLATFPGNVASVSKLYVLPAQAALYLQGADGDTLETLSDQLDGIGGIDGQDVADALLLAPSGVAAAGSAMAELAAIMEDTGTTLPGLIAAGGGLNLDTVLETPLTLGEALRIMLAALKGKTTGSGTPTLEFYGQDGATVRISATVDGVGNRTAVTVDGAEA